MTGAPVKPLAPRDQEILDALVKACAAQGGPVSPRHIGGSAGSDHSARLQALAKIGLVQVRSKNPWGGGKVYLPVQQ